MTYEEYDALPGVRAGHLKALAVSPKQYQHEMSNPSPDATHLRLGRANHACILEPDTFLDRFCVYPGPVRRGKEWEAFRGENEHRDIVTQREFDAALAIGVAVTTHPVAARYLTEGVAEQTLTWRDYETDLACKCRVDFLGAHLVEVKSTSKLEPRRFATDAARLGYHIQIAHCMAGAEASRIDVAPEPILIAVSSSPPHDVVVYEVPEHVLRIGQDRRRDLLRRLLECQVLEYWPGIAEEGLEQFELPAWADPAAELHWDLEEKIA